MSNKEESVERAVNADRHVLNEDPYVLKKEKIMDPPRGWRPSLRFLGPGMVTSAAVVGSGELLTATTLGAKAGFMLLWLIFVSTFVKVAVQIELARWSISTGQVAIAGYDKVPPRIFGRGWISWFQILLIVQIVIGQGGVIGAGALAFAMVFPVNGDPTSFTSLALWVTIMVLVTIGIHLANKYSIVEKVSTFLVILITLLAVIMVFGIQVTPFAWTAADFGGGLTFRIAAGSMGVALGMFGMTGVGASEITAYTFWCVEKGYAAWTGPNDGSDEWVDRARGWISVMKKDAWVSWLIYTISTAAFYILGASVLHPQGLEPEGDEVLETISRIFTDTMGDWVRVIFLLGAGIALLKTILANAPGFSRHLSNLAAVFNLFDWKDGAKRDAWMRALIIILPICWGLFAVVFKAPLAAVIIAGIGNAIFLMAVVIGTIYLSYKETDPRVKGGTVWNIYLMISAVAIFAVGVMGLIDQF